MSTQSFENHRRLTPIFHFWFLGIMLCLAIAAGYNLFTAESDDMLVAVLLFALCFMLILAGFMARSFALKAQDRAIRAEEKLRYFLLAKQAMPAGLGMKQFVALRFASNEEYVGLANEAAAKNLPPAEIKKKIKQWRADEYRV